MFSLFMMQPIIRLVDRTSAIETLHFVSIPCRVKSQTIKICFSPILNGRWGIFASPHSFCDKSFQKKDFYVEST